MEMQKPKTIWSFGGKIRSGNLGITDGGVVLTIWPNGVTGNASDESIYIPSDLVKGIIKALQDERV